MAVKSKIQKENLELLSTQFEEGVVRATWLPSKLNLSDTLTRAVVNPIQVVNSLWYRNGIAHNGEEFVNLVREVNKWKYFPGDKGR